MLYISSPLSCVVDMRDKIAGDDGRSTARREHFAHEALQHFLILVVITSEGLQLAFKTHFYSQGQLWVLQANKVTCRREGNMKREITLEVIFCLCFGWAFGTAGRKTKNSEMGVNIPLYERQSDLLPGFKTASNIAQL